MGKFSFSITNNVDRATYALMKYGAVARKIAVEDFDPNTTDAHVWGVYNGSKFKLYEGRGPALNALMRARAAKLFENIEGRWVERAYMPNNNLTFEDRPCDICGARPMAVQTAWQKQNGIASGHSTGWWSWKRQGSKIAEPLTLLFLCYTCKANHG